MNQFLKKLIPDDIIWLGGIWREQRRKKASVLAYNVTAGRNVFIEKDCKIGKKVRIGNNVDLYKTEIGYYSYFSGKNISHNCLIGKFSSIGPNVILGLGEHPIRNTVSTHPAFFTDKNFKRQTYAPDDYVQKFESFKEIIIGNDVWIGEGARIKGGITIGDGAIIGAGAMVVKDVEPYAIVGGIPSKLIRYRFSTEQISFLLKFKWWDRSDEWLRENWKLFFNIDDFIKKNKDTHDG
jgi:acetyltransferase-like isoleucine patch superfamily enzyme